MTEKQFELEVLNDNEYVIAEFDKDNYYLDDENSAKALECRLNELYDENEQLKSQIATDFNQSNCITVQKSKIKDLEKENEELKQKVFKVKDENTELKHKINYLQNRLDDYFGLEKENEDKVGGDFK